MRRKALVVGSVLVAILLLVLVLTLGGGPTGSTTRVGQVIPLPGFDPLYHYSFGNNYVPSKDGPYDYSQIPVLANSPEQPRGIYYVNNLSELTEYEIGSGAVRAIAHVTPLYQNWSSYAGMLPNDFTLPYGLDEALLFGTVRLGAPNVSIETVNLTTGSVILRNTTLAIDPHNQQVNLISNNIALVFSTLQPLHPRCIDCNATVTGFNLSNGTSWTAGTVPWFEANNVYWLPQRGQLINVEAYNSNGDRVEQLNETTNAFGEPQFAAAVAVSVDSNVYVEWVDGIAYNATTDQIAYTVGGYGITVTYVLDYGSLGLLQTVGEVRYTNPTDILEGQSYVYTSDYVTGGVNGATQYEFDPWNGSTKPMPATSFGMVPSVCDGYCFLGSSSTNPGYRIDFQATVETNYPFWSVVLDTPSP